MCEEHGELSPEERSIVAGVEMSRRSVLGGAVALAGGGVAAGGVALAGSAAADGGPSARRARRPDPLIITGANLLDPLTGRVRENAVLACAGGRVVLVGTEASLRSARRGWGDAVRIVDVAGRFVVPGMLDAHVHVSTLDSARRALLGGATTVRSASTSFFQDVGVKALGRYQPEAAPTMVPAGVFVTPFLGDTVLADPALAPLASLSDGVREPRDLAFVTGVNIERGAGAVKTRATERAGLPEQDPREQVYFYDQLSAVVAAGRRRRTPVLCHSHGQEGCYDAVRAGVASLEHGTWVDERTLSLMARKGTFLTPTFSAVVDLAEPGGEYTDPRLVERGREMLAALRPAVAEAHRRGVRLVAGTDTSYTAATRSSIGGEVAHLTSAGISNLDALRAATTNAAELFGLPRKGRLERGFDADAVVVDGDPLSDVTALRRVAMVVAGGAVAKELAS